MWNLGYTSEIEYTAGYYSELSPARIRLALMSCGIDHSVPDNPTYLELGFGQGLSLNINAATNSGSFYGTDFNPGQVANARELADAMGKPIVLLEDSFEQLAARSDLPQFDIIALHGIWSWISDGSRQAILGLARDALKPGGVLYISYNVTPGWSPVLPLRTLLSEYGKREATGPLLARVEQSIAFADRVIDAGAAYFVQNPSLKARLDHIKSSDKNYVAHEYFNAHWDPMPFSEVADQLSEAKLTFSASANIAENIPVLCIPAGAAEVLSGIHDPILRETVRDYFCNQQFRRDIFVKGARKMTAYDSGKRIMRETFILLGDPEKCPAKIQASVGEVELRPEIYKPLVEAMAQFPGWTASVEALLAHPDLAKLNRAQVWEALLVLTAANFVAPISRSLTPEADEAASRALNKLLLERAEASAGVEFLAAPRLGAAISLSRIDQLFLRAQEIGESDPIDFVCKLLASQSQRLIVDGKTVEEGADTRKELERLFQEFTGSRCDILKRVGVI